MKVIIMKLYINSEIRMWSTLKKIKLYVYFVGMIIYIYGMNDQNWFEFHWGWKVKIILRVLSSFMRQEIFISQ